MVQDGKYHVDMDRGRFKDGSVRKELNRPIYILKIL